MEITSCDPRVFLDECNGLKEGHGKVKNGSRSGRSSTSRIKFNPVQIRLGMFAYCRRIFRTIKDWLDVIKNSLEDYYDMFKK